MPCNNDLLAENFIGAGDELRLIDYEYSGNNEAVVRARQRLERVEPLADEQLDELVARLLRPAAPATRSHARAFGG